MKSFLQFYDDLWFFSNFQKSKKFSFYCGEHSISKFGTENSLFPLKLVFRHFLRHCEGRWGNDSKSVQKRALMQKVSFRFQILVLNAHRSKKKTFSFLKMWRKSNINVTPQKRVHRFRFSKVVHFVNEGLVKWLFLWQLSEKE